MAARDHHLLYDFIVSSESPSPQFIPPRVIPDVNVLLNGITGKPGSLNRRLYEGFTHGLVQFVISEPWLEEFERVLNYPQVINLGITPSLVAKTMRELLLLADYVAPVPRFDWTGLGDLKDWYLLDLLWESGCDGLITQDSKVHRYGQKYGLPIYKPGELVKMGILSSN